MTVQVRLLVVAVPSGATYRNPSYAAPEIGDDADAMRRAHEEATQHVKGWLAPGLWTIYAQVAFAKARIGHPDERHLLNVRGSKQKVLDLRDGDVVDSSERRANSPIRMAPLDFKLGLKVQPRSVDEKTRTGWNPVAN